MTEPTTHTLEVPGAVLAYDVRPGSDDRAIPLVMVASPQGAAGFTTLAGHFTDRTVVTYDPRHCNERSTLTTDEEPTPGTHADDIHRVIRAAVEPTIFASHHGGFLGGEYGQTGDPDAFAQTLREVLEP